MHVNQDVILVIKRSRSRPALSGGNAFVGHHKSVSILATLYKDGHAIDSYTTTRSSQGGLLAGFKGSCSVLYRCVDTLGSDISRWVNSKQ